MNSNEISVICLQEISCDNEPQENKEKESTVTLKDISKPLGISFGIIAFSIVFSLFWTIIPRTNTIIYQSYWMEPLIPTTSIYFLLAGLDFLNLTVWTEEKSLLSPFVFLKMFAMYMITAIFFYILSHAIWSVYLEYNHPLPNLGLTIWAIVITFCIGLWFILPSNLLTKTEFRKKLRIYMLYKLWTQISGILKEVLAYFFANPPATYQFLVPFMIAGCREVDKYFRATLITRMMGMQNESAAILNAINVSSGYSLFIAIRIVGAEFSTIFCIMAIDFFFNLRTAYGKIKELKRIKTDSIENETTHNDMSMILAIEELIEGFTPIIYAAGMTMAYYGPNAHIFSTVGNSYWSERIEDIGPLLVTMTILFGVYTLNLLTNSFYLWKAAKVNMPQEFCEVLGKYWHFMAINFACLMTTHFAANDVNFGMDGTQSFQWISQQGWMNLVNNSNVLNDEEKVSLLQIPSMIKKQEPGIVLKT